MKSSIDKSNHDFPSIGAEDGNEAEIEDGNDQNDNDDTDGDLENPYSLISNIIVTTECVAYSTNPGSETKEVDDTIYDEPLPC